MSTDPILQLRHKVDYLAYFHSCRILLISSNNGVLAYDLQLQTLESVIETEFDLEHRHKEYILPKKEEFTFHFPNNALKNTPPLMSIARPRYNSELGYMLMIGTADTELRVLKFSEVDRKFSKTRLKVMCQYPVADFKFLPSSNDSILV